jgi:methyl-accepting chemotaxis protein
MTIWSQQLRSSFLLAGAAAAVGLAIAVAIGGGQDARRTLQRLADQRGGAIGNRVAALASAYLRERRHEVEALAISPTIVGAARQASLRAADLKLDRIDPAELVRRGSTLGGDPAAQAFVRAYAQHSDIASLLVTESHGLSVVATGRTGLDHRREAWWQVAMRDGTFEGDARYDSAAASIEYAVALRAAGVARPVGVLKASFTLEKLGQLLAVTDLGDSAYLQIVDNTGRVILTPNRAELLAPLADGQAIPREGGLRTVVLRTGRGPELVISIPANQGRWWVLFRQPTSRAYAAWLGTRRTIWVGSGALLLVTMLLVWRLGSWLNQRVTAPLRAAGVIASRVAGGDLSVTLTGDRSGSSEVAELLSSVHSMVVALRQLVGAIRAAADEAAAMAAEISASTEEMSASTQEMSATCQDLSRRAAEQAQLVRAAADDAAKILQIITILALGADDSVRRNSNLTALARRNKEVLDQSTAQLTQLADEVERGAAEADALATASTEIQKFVAQTKAVATQTNMLALNAAIEAARAGPQGRGFAVVADEVRKLASVAAAAAGQTADTVRGVLARVQATRDRLRQLAQGGAAAREAAQTAAQGLATVAAEAEANDAWSREIAKSTGEVRTLVEEIAARLQSVAESTEGLLAATEEIAASSEEQTASTQEVASSANQLAEAADRLTGAVQSFRLLAPDQASPSPSPVQEAAD